LSRRFTVLHSYGLDVLHLPLGTALHAIGFHSSPPFGQTCTLRAHSLWPESEDVKRRGNYRKKPAKKARRLSRLKLRRVIALQKRNPYVSQVTFRLYINLKLTDAFSEYRE